MTVADYPNAIKAFVKLVNHAPGNAVYRAKLAIAMASYPRTAKGAEREFLEALRIDPDNPDLHYQFGMYYKVMKQRARALAEMQTAVRLNPRHAAGPQGAGGPVAEGLRAQQPEEAVPVVRPAEGGGDDADGGQRSGGGHRQSRLGDPYRFHGKGEADHAEDGLGQAAWSRGEPDRQTGFDQAGIRAPVALSIRQSVAAWIAAQTAQPRPSANTRSSPSDVHAVATSTRTTMHAAARTRRRRGWNAVRPVPAQSSAPYAYDADDHAPGDEVPDGHAQPRTRRRPVPEARACRDRVDHEVQRDRHHRRGERPPPARALVAPGHRHGRGDDRRPDHRDGQRHAERAPRATTRRTRASRTRPWPRPRP